MLDETNSGYRHLVYSIFAELFRKTRGKNSGDISTLLQSYCQTNCWQSIRFMSDQIVCAKRNLYEISPEILRFVQYGELKSGVGSSQFIFESYEVDDQLD